MAPPAIVGAGLAAPEALPMLARGGAALAGRVVQAATKAGHFTSRAGEAVNNFALGAMGKAAGTVGTVAPKAGTALLRPATYQHTVDAISAYLPTGAPEANWSGYAGGIVGNRTELSENAKLIIHAINKAPKD